MRDVVDLVVLGALWGASFLFLRIAVPEFGPVPLIFVRVAIAAVLLAGVLIWRGGIRALAPIAGPLVVLGAMNTAVPFSLFAFAALSLPAGLTSALNATVPLFGALAAVVWLGERLAALRVAGLLTGFAGVVVLAWPKLGAGGERLAVLAALSATMLYALAAHYTRRHLSGVVPLVVATGSQIAATIVTLPYAVAAWPAPSPSSRAWACAVALGVGCTAVAYVLYFRLIARAGAVTALAVTYLIPVFGVTWGAIVLGERLPASAVAGALLVLAGVALTTRT
jgi:drug/metabolite transporter (DMT)-like permease